MPTRNTIKCSSAGQIWFYKTKVRHFFRINGISPKCNLTNTVSYKHAKCICNSTCAYLIISIWKHLKLLIKRLNYSLYTELKVVRFFLFYFIIYIECVNDSSLNDYKYLTRELISTGVLQVGILTHRLSVYAILVALIWTFGITSEK